MSGVHVDGHHAPMPKLRLEPPEVEPAAGGVAVIGRDGPDGATSWPRPERGEAAGSTPDASIVDDPNARSSGRHPEPILETAAITFAYPDGTVALRDLSVAIPGGRRVAILGANGSGKSTLFLQLNGILRPAQGTIRLAGRPVRYDRQGLAELRRRVGLLFQDPDTQLFAASVRQDVSFGPLNLGWPEDVVRAKVEQAIRDTQIEELADRPTHLLSYGQKKRVAIAGLLAMETEIIVADEPTAGLDPEMSARLLDLFNRLHRQGHTIVMSTHDVELALAWADYAVVLRRGQVLGAGRPEELFSDPELVRQARLVQPIVLDVYGQLRACGLLTNGTPLPRTAGQLAALIARSAACTGHAPEPAQ